MSTSSIPAGSPPQDAPDTAAAGSPGPQETAPTVAGDKIAGGRGRPWYRRRAVLVAGAVVLIAAITVVSDLPQKASSGQKVADAKSVLHALDTDVHPCAYSVQQTFDLYQRQLDGTVTAGERGQIPGLMRDDQDACSFANATIFNLSTITLPGTPAGRDMGTAVNTVTLWATSDALAAIEDVQALTTNPHDAKAQSGLTEEVRLLAGDRAKADAEVAAASRAAGGHIPAPTLPRLPEPTPPSGP